jgi:hypothetical protein
MSVCDRISQTIAVNRTQLTLHGTLLHSHGPKVYVPFISSWVRMHPAATTAAAAATSTIAEGGLSSNAAANGAGANADHGILGGGDRSGWKYRYWTDDANRKLVELQFPEYLATYDGMR